MKLVLIALIAFVAGVTCAPQPDTETVPFTDEDGLRDIDQIFKLCEKALKGSKLEDHWLLMYLNGLERECILNQYKKYNIESQIAKVLAGFDSYSDRDYVSVYTAIFVTSSCYKNLDAILEYIFNNYMTTNILYRAFADEPELALYVDMIRCFNAYAVDHNVIDQEGFNYNTQVNYTENCDEIKKEIRKHNDNFVSTAFRNSKELPYKECFTKVMKTTENLVLRYLLLVQVQLTDEQKVQERANFIKDFYARIDDVAYCAANPTNEVENEV